MKVHDRIACCARKRRKTPRRLVRVSLLSLNALVYLCAHPLSRIDVYSKEARRKSAATSVREDAFTRSAVK